MHDKHLKGNSIYFELSTSKLKRTSNHWQQLRSLIKQKLWLVQNIICLNALKAFKRKGSCEVFGVSLLKVDLWNYFVKSVVSAGDLLALRATVTKQLYEKNRSCLNARCLGISLLAKRFKITHQFCQMKKPHLLYLTVVKTVLFFSDRENKALLNRLFLNFAVAVKTAHHMTNIQTAGPVYSAFPRSFASSFSAHPITGQENRRGCVLES